MQQTEVFIYQQRLELNKETILTLEFFGRLTDFQALIVASLTDEARADEAEGDWKGLVTNMKDYFAKIMKNLKIHQDQKEKEFREKLVAVEDTLKEVSKQVTLNQVQMGDLKEETNKKLDEILAKLQ